MPGYAGTPTDNVLNYLCTFLLNLPSHGIPLDVSGWMFAPSGSTALLGEPVHGVRLNYLPPVALEEDRRWGAFLPWMECDEAANGM